MVRVAGVYGQVKAGIEESSQDGRTQAQQLVVINEAASELMIKQQACWKALSIELGVAGIHVLEPDLLKAEELRWLEVYFLDRVFPVLTPLAFDPANHFP